MSILNYSNYSSFSEPYSVGNFNSKNFSGLFLDNANTGKEMGLFTSPSGTFAYINGNTDSNAQLGASAPAVFQSDDLSKKDGDDFGVINVSAPVASTSTTADYTLSLSTSGIATQNRVALVIDVSGSMGWDSSMEDTKKAYIELIKHLDAQGMADDIAIIPFNHDAQLHEGLTAQQAIELVDSLYADGGTNFGSAVDRAYEFFDGKKVPGQNNVVYFLSDGEGDGASDKLHDIADVRAFGVGDGADMTGLNIIDSDNAESLNSARDLADSFGKSEINKADIVEVRVYVNGEHQDTIDGDSLVEDGNGGISYSGSVSNLKQYEADAVDFEVIFKDGNGTSSKTITVNIADGITLATGSDGDDKIVLALTQKTVDAGSGTDTVFANDLDNTIYKLEGDGIIQTFGGDDTIAVGNNQNGQFARVIDGGEGSDTVVYSGNRADYNIETNGKLVKVEGADNLSNVEFLKFDDVTIRASDLSVVEGTGLGSQFSDAGISMFFVDEDDTFQIGDISTPVSTPDTTAAAYLSDSGASMSFFGSETDSLFSFDDGML